MINKAKIYLLFPFFFLLLAPPGQITRKNPVAYNASEVKFEVGEELVYVVRYSVMRLGEVRVKITGKDIIDGKNYYRAIIYIDSYKGLPFVDLHQVYETVMTPDYYSKYFKGIIKQDSVVSNTEYHFDYNKSEVKIHKWFTNSDKAPVDSTCEVHKKYQDGLSIFYYARAHSREKREEIVPTFVNEKKVSTEIKFNTELDDASVDAIDYDVDCTHMEGHVNFISVFGLTGYFEGWFSNDEEAIPIKAKMNVIIGSITLELKSWKKQEWTPPRYKD